MEGYRIKMSVALFAAMVVNLLWAAAVSGSAPPRLEVLLEETLWLTKTESVTALDGKSYAVIYWEEPTNSQSQSLHSVYLLDVTETSVSRAYLGKGTRVTLANAGEYEKNYIGYYRYPATDTSANAQLINYVNYIFEVGSGPYQEARIYPPRPNAHTNYQKNTDTCSGCHRTHYAVHPKLLNRKIMQEMCLECHDGSKSSYDVLRGLAKVPSGYAASPAGPFGTKKNPSTSFHNVFLEDEFDKPLSEQFLLYAPGGGERLNLTCTNCHSAHVTTSSSRYRFLKFAQDTPVQAYTFVEGNEYKVLYKDGMNQFCGQCHSEYNYGSATNLQGYPEHVLRADGGKGIQKSGDYYRHPTGINIDSWSATAKMTLPVEHRDDGGKYMTCKTCHVAHGTAIISSDQYSPELSDPALDLPEKDRYKYLGYSHEAVNAQTYSSMLKRRQGMGICLECHLDQIWGNTPGSVLMQ